MPEAILQRRKMMDFPSSPGGHRRGEVWNQRLQAFSRGKGGELIKWAEDKQELFFEYTW